jgi:hypothetical protein
MKNSKIIPIQYPTVTTYGWHSSLLSLIEPHTKSHDWIYSNYIRFTGGIADNNTLILDFLPNVIDYVICPMIRPMFFSREYIKNHYTSFKEFLIESIDSDYAIFCIVNEQHILAEFTGKPCNRFCHELLIYGYDLSLNIANVADYTFTNKLSFEEVNIDSLCCGYADVTDDEDYIAHKREGVFILRFNDEADYKFDPWLVKSALEEYYTGNGFEYTTHTIMAHNAQIDGSGRMGVEAYKLLYQHIRNLEDTDAGFDIRNPHAIFDHKVLMIKRAKYMMEHKHMEQRTDVIAALESIRDKAQQMRNLYLKLSINKSKDQITRLLNGYYDIETRERELYPKLIDMLRIPE